jgi:hypothetical protein
LGKIGRERNKINEIENVKEDVTTKNNKIQRNIRKYFKNLQSNKLENPEEMDKFLDTPDQPKLNQKDVKSPE